MERQVKALILVLLLLLLAGCSSNSQDVGSELVSRSETPAFQAREASSLDWGTPVVVESANPSCNVGRSMAMVDGHPAIAYQLWSNDGPEPGFTLYYVRADDAEGSSWGSPTAVTFWPLQDPYTNNCSMCVVNGKPAIAYRAMPNGSAFSNLYYVQANDATGYTWGSPVMVNPPDDDWFDAEGANASMIVINGKPAVWYKDAGDMKYIRAKNPDGSKWGNPHILYTPGQINSTWSSAFAEVNGRPAVAWGLNGELKYLRADDANGDNWGSAITVLADGGGYWRNRMMIVDGFPAIACSGGMNSNAYVRFIRALDADGTTWPAAAVEVTTKDDNIGEAMGNLAVVDGVPSIIFLSGIGGTSIGQTLDFVQALDSLGNAWETPETIANLGSNSENQLVGLGAGAGVCFRNDLTSVNYISSIPPPPDPAVNVQLSTDNSNYIIGQDTEAVLTAVVTDEYGNPISGLGTGAFVTTLDGGGVSVGFSEGSTPGTYSGNLDISALVEGSYVLETSVTDARALTGSGSATFAMSEAGGATMHVGDLDASITNGPHNRWRVVFTIKVGDSSHTTLGGADVSFSLNGSSSSNGQLTTGADGTASYQTGWINGSGTLTFTVDGVTHASFSYSPADNHDPDGDSNGTTITVVGP